jgi:hypothetical protein
MNPALPNSRPAPRFSASDDDATHGRKLFWVYAKQHGDHGYASTEASPVGQVIVKENWHPLEVTSAEAEGLRAKGQQVVTFGGKHWRPDGQADLFIMVKCEEGTPNTHNGWYYARMDPTDQKLISSDAASCLRCHRHGPYDSLHGLPE